MKNNFMKNRTVRITASFLLGLLVILGIGRLLQNPKQPSKNSRPLRIGMMSGWPPFMSIDERGACVGFDVDVARLLGKLLGCDVQIVDGGSLSTLFLSLETGKIDMIFSGLDITEERRKRMNMVPYTGEDTTYLCAIFSGKIPRNVTGLGDLAQLPGAVICFEANSASEELLKYYPNIGKKELKGMADMVLDVRTGKSTALLAEPQVAGRLLKKDESLIAIKVPLPTELKMYGCGIALKKTNGSLAEKVSAAICSLRRSGELAELEQKWNLRGA